MSQPIINQYLPESVSPPGETLLETLENLNMSQAELAERTGRPKKTINEIIRGKAAITPETAIQFERVLGIPATFWNSRERNYREYLAKKEEKERLENEKEWLSLFPLSEMVERSLIKAINDKVGLIQEVLNYFGVASPDQWRTMWKDLRISYRRSAFGDISIGALSVWLRQGELIARQTECAIYDTERFRSALAEARKLTSLPIETSTAKLSKICGEAGVVVIFVPEFPRTRVFGATCWVTPTKALIQLSLYYKRDDHLWFTFFHEAGHILLHGKRDSFIELDKIENEKEEQANRFAANFLVPEDQYREFVASDYQSKAAILEFASMIGVAPGIVVGRLQHDGYLPHTHCNDLKRRLMWKYLEEK